MKIRNQIHCRFCFSFSVYSFCQRAPRVWVTRNKQTVSICALHFQEVAEGLIM